MNLNQITLPSNDVERSARFYEALGFQLIVQSFPRYARFECDEGGATFSLHHVNQVQRNSGFTVYFECADVDHTVERLESAGIEFDQSPRDESWLWREARLSDPDGNVICLYHAGDNRRHPPWRVTEPDS